MQTGKSKRAKEKIRKRRRQVFTYSCLILFVIGLSYLFIWQRIYSLRLAREYAAQQQRLNLLEEKLRHLNLEIAELMSMQRLEKLAKDRLALKPLRKQQILSIEDLYPTDSVQTHSGGRIIAAGLVSDPVSSRSQGK